MTVAPFLLGIGLLVLWVGPPAVAARMLRRRVLPGWCGAPALLVDVLSTMALVVTAAQLVGALGGLTRLGLTAACFLIGVCGGVLALRLPVVPARVVDSPEEPGWSRSLGLLSTAGVIGVWLSKTRFVLEIGNFDTDSLVYHWPYAAFFAQTGWTTRIHLGAPGGAVSWHAANGELLGGISILAFHRDWMLPLLNLGWLVLALVAAYVAGRRIAVGGLAVAVTCVVLALPILARTQGGSGFTDVAGLALVLAAVALFLEAFDDELAPRVLLWSGVAAGLAASTKETTLAVGVVLGLSVVLLSRRAAASLAWLAPAVLLGAFWYVRNLVREGNPVPTSHLGPFRSVAGSYVDTYGYSVAHFLADGNVVRHTFVPGLGTAWGWAWPVLILGCLLAAGLTLRAGTTGAHRALALVGVTGLVAYLITPTTALAYHGVPVLFAENTRYALPAVVVLAVLLVRLTGPRVLMGLAVLITLLGTIGSRGRFPTLLPHRGGQALLMALLFLAAVVLLRRVTAPVALALAAVVAVPALFLVGRAYEQDRYPVTAGDASRTFAWAASVHGAHIGLDGISEEYPFTGRDVSNRVDYLGVRNDKREFTEAPSCPVWRRAVNTGMYDYLVVGPALNGSDLPPASHWVDVKAMSAVLVAGDYRVYRVLRPLDLLSC